MVLYKFYYLNLLIVNISDPNDSFEFEWDAPTLECFIQRINQGNQLGSTSGLSEEGLRNIHYVQDREGLIFRPRFIISIDFGCHED